MRGNEIVRQGVHPPDRAAERAIQGGHERRPRLFARREREQRRPSRPIRGVYSLEVIVPRTPYRTGDGQPFCRQVTEQVSS
jgi:ribosomal protein L34E